jgi:SAM-dependent methyltransferase
MTTHLEHVRDFWNENPCGSKTVDAPFMSPEFFFDYERKRYETEPYIREFLAADDVRGKRVVEIGCGMGTDGVQLAKAGADYLGVDLTPMAAKLTHTNFSVRGLPGRVVNASVERLPLADGSVDFVYSHGVIHHTPDIERAVSEIRRVLRPGGRIHLMLYHRHSYNYYVSILLLRRLGALLLLAPGGVGLARRLTGEPVENLEIHKTRLKSQGIGYLFGPQWLSYNTDGAQSPLARVYSRGGAKELLQGFAEFQFRVANINKRHLPIVGSFLPRAIEAWLGRSMGWHLHIFAVRA